MITEMTFLDVIIVLIIILPFIWLARIERKHKRKWFKQFTGIAHENGLNITEKEYWANSCIGIDSAKKMLLFVRSEADTMEKALIDLKQIRECEVNTSVKNIRTKTKKERILEKVDLQIYSANSKSAVKTLNFYDHDRNYSEDLEVRRAEKWKQIIKENSVPAMVTSMAI